MRIDRIDRITLAVTHVDAVIAFYNEIFDSGIEPLGDSPLYAGTLGGVPLLVCPNEIAGVDASQSRHQLRFVVDDIEDVLAHVPLAGGSLLNRDRVGGRLVVGISDPDGNTYELIEDE
jgi:predicted enzyme related to lactoylglutathione lyase